jgi:hypothetical protein
MTVSASVRLALRAGFTGMVLFLNGQEKPPQDRKQTPDAEKKEPAKKPIKPVPRGTIIPGAIGVDAPSRRQGTVSQEEHLRKFEAGCEAWWKSCESRAAIPTSGSSPTELTIVSAARFAAEDPDYPGMFVFEYQCSAPASLVEVRVHTVLQPTIAPQNREMKTVMSCDSGRVVWNPAFEGVNGDTPNLDILMTEIPEQGDPVVISPVVRARRSERPDPAHRVTLSFPAGKFQSFVSIPDLVTLGVSQTQASRQSTKATIILSQPGGYRIAGILPLEPSAPAVRIRVSDELR